MLPASLFFPRCCYLPPFIPGTRFSLVMLTEPNNLSALISTLLWSPRVGGFLQSCSGEGSAGDITPTSARAPQLWWEHLGSIRPPYVPGCPGRAHCRALGRSLGSTASSAWSLPAPLISHCYRFPRFALSPGVLLVLAASSCQENRPANPAVCARATPLGSHG